MPSLVAQAKRALVAALKSVARTYGVRVDLTGDSPDAAVRSAYRRVFLRAHPDKGGSVEHAQRKEGEGDVEAHGARRSQKIELLSLSETLLEVSRKCHSSVAPHECFPHYVCRTPETQCLGERRLKGAALERMWSTCWGVQVSCSL